jgi:hypothetical protein
MSETSDTPTDLDPPDPRYRVPSILTIAFGAMVLVITGSWAALVGRSATLGTEPLAGAIVESMLLMNTGGPLIMVIGLALRRAPGSPARKSLIAVCLTGLWFYGKFMSGLFS